ncbi:MAG: GC-type dockerin domain-anchored protein [Phycisphaerales bacterium JB059]
MRGRNALALIALAAGGVAKAEFIELQIAIAAVPGDIVSTLGGVTATVVFDTADAPTDSTLQTVTFDALTGSIEGVLFGVDPETNPSAANAAPVRLTGPIDSGNLIYSQTGDENMRVTLTQGQTTLTLTVFSPAGDFTPVMPSLPDAPEAYVVEDETDFRVQGNVLHDAMGIFTTIDRSGSFVVAIGGVSYNARLVGEPVVPPCNGADLAEPYGQLDFDDILAFLTAFAGMELSADLAPPTCTFNFDDVLAFLTAYAAGCP